MNLGTWNRLLTLGNRVLDRNRATEPFIRPHETKPAFSGTPTQGLPRVTPESQGVSSRTIAEFFSALQQDGTLNMHSVMVLRHGRVLATATFGSQQATVWRTTFSMCKSITGLAVGMLIDDGLLTVENRVVDFFEDELNPLTKLKWRELTVEDLLTMRSGATFSEAESMCEEDWVKAFFAFPVQGAIGERYRYNSLNTYMLSAIVQKVSGQSLSAFLRTRLFDPLEIGDVYWETCPKGIEKGGWGLYIRPEDMAKIGQLFLQRGMWQGNRLISQQWIDASIEPRVQVPEGYGDYRYGYQVWTAKDDSRFLMNGMLGQNVMGFWQSGILLVSCAGNDEMFQQSRYFDIAHRVFGVEFPDTLPEDAHARAQLQQTLAALRSRYPERPKQRWCDRLRKRPYHLLPEWCEQLDGAAFEVCEPAPSVGLMPLSLQVTTNRYTKGICGLRFEVADDRLILYYAEEGAEHRLPVAFYETAYTMLTFEGDRYEVAVDGRCAHDEDDRPVLIVNVCFLETPFSRRIKCTLCGETMQLRQHERPGEPFVWQLLEQAVTDLERHQPLVGGALQKLDLEYLHYKTERQFTPRVQLKKVKKSENFSM